MTGERPRVGDIVTRGKAKTPFIVEGMWASNPNMLSLKPVQGYTGASASVESVQVVARPEDTCNHRPEKWGRWKGIDGAVLLCHTHGYPMQGPAYDDNDGRCQAFPPPD